jgi:hypothetical protein
MGKVSVVQTLCSFSIPLPKSVMDPDSLNPYPDTDSDPTFQVNPDPCDGFFWRLMLAHLVTLWRVIPSPLPMEIKQYRYLNFDKSHPLILNYHEKVLGYGHQKFWSLEISDAFFGISQNKVVT